MVHFESYLFNWVPYDRPGCDIYSKSDCRLLRAATMILQEVYPSLPQLYLKD